MSETALVGRRVPETREARPSIITGRSAREQYARLNRMARLTGAVGIVNTARFMHGRWTGTDHKDIIPVRTDKLRFPFRMTPSPNDVTSLHEILGDEVYALPSKLSDRVKGKQIVDMGAYIGMSAAYFASRYPDSPVMAVEPHERNFRMLAANADPYGGQIDTRQAAFVRQPGGIDRIMLGSQEAHMAFKYISSGSEHDDPRMRSTAMTPGILLDEIEGDGIGLLKVDIEGAEREVFSADGIDELLSMTELLMVETHDNLAPGSSRAVEEATMRSGMQPMELNPHTIVYMR